MAANESTRSNVAAPEYSLESSLDTPLQAYAVVAERDIDLEAYWRQSLSQAPPCIGINADFPIPSQVAWPEPLAQIACALPDNIHKHIRTFCEERNLTQETLFLTSYAVLLARHSQQFEFLIFVEQQASEPAARSPNLIPVVVRLREDMSFSDALLTVQSTLQEAENSAIPCDSAVRLINSISPSIEPHGRRLAFGHYPSVDAVVHSSCPLLIPDIGLFITTDHSSSSLRLSYRPDIFSADRITRMSTHLSVLLQAAMVEEDTPIVQLPLTGEAERKRVIEHWNATKADFPTARMVHSLFKLQADLTPDEIAVEFGDSKLTYRELDHRAHQLARFLQLHGAGPDVPVGLYLERSVDLAVVVLSILKSGSFYVPLDSSYPAERIGSIVDESRVSIIVTQQPLADKLPSTDSQLILLPHAWEAISECALPELSFTGNEESLAYALFTSGSTGKPKGVAMPHRALANLVNWQIRQPGLNRPARTLQYSPIGFDVSFQEIFTTWCQGGTLVMTSEAVRQEPGNLWRYCCSTRIERLFLPFVALQQLAERADVNSEQLPPLQEVITAGEQLQITPAIRHLFARLPECSLHNHYGPTEAHVVTAHTLEPPSEQWPSLPPIGRPISNTQIYLLDSGLQPVPVGIPGELYIGGDQVAHGYLQRDDLTRDRFLPNPFDYESQLGADRIYKSGDLARWTQDGSIECLGRVDRQVKIRGFRIEIGEIEAVISRHSEVRESAVITSEDASGNKRLVAYIVPREDAQEIAQIGNRLQNYLTGILPGYMIPSTFITLDAMPVSPNGKLDRNKLPSPAEPNHRTQEAVGARTHIESELIQIWESVFNISPIGIEDDFFALGGHSLIGGRLLATIAQALGKDLPLTSLVSAPTIRQQAELIKQSNSTSTWRSLVGIKTNGSLSPVFGIHAAQGTVLFYQSLARSLNSNRSFYGLQQQGLNGRRTAINTVEAMATHYIEEIRTVQPSGPYHLAGYCFGGIVAFEMARQLTQMGHEVGLVALINAAPPDYDFSKGRPLPADSPDQTIPSPIEQSPATGGPSIAKLKRRIHSRLRRLRWAANLAWKRRVPVLALSMGLTIPWEYRTGYASGLNDRATKQYTAQPYDGPVVAVTGAGLFYDPCAGWRNKARGGVETYQIDGQFKLLGDIMMEPSVGKLAEILEHEISKVEHARKVSAYTEEPKQP